jgi:hypothetical protein
MEMQPGRRSGTQLRGNGGFPAVQRRMGDQPQRESTFTWPCVHIIATVVREMKITVRLKAIETFASRETLGASARFGK